MAGSPVTSPNFGPRRHGLSPDMVVIHYTAMESCQAAVERLCDPAAEVSAHYVISESGEVFPLVSEDERAWHAGAGRWGNVGDVNSHSIGIELANQAAGNAMPPFPEPQMRVLERLLGDILARRKQIPPARVIGHSDMAPGRKFDPGPKFDWQRLARQGLSIWPDNLPDADADPVRFKQDAQTFGYHPPSSNTDRWQTLLDAFRLRFNPSEIGDLTAQDCRRMAALARDYPVQNVDLGTPIA